MDRLAEVMGWGAKAPFVRKQPSGQPQRRSSAGWSLSRLSG